MPRRQKMTREEREKRAARNERRGRNAERKSDDNPRIGRGAGPVGLGYKSRTPGEGTQRAIKNVVEHAQKWVDAEKCNCRRCVTRRELEAEFKRGKKQMVRR